jgi:pimeloyl-ACP methyl ester carboxylesterase
MKRNFVLVHGAWFGGWVWKPVARELRSHGHEVTAPTLTGLGERRHLAASVTGLETHVRDVVEHIRTEGLYDVNLVGWSYGGMVVAGVASELPDRIRSLVYLDAFVPADGAAMIDYAEPWVKPLILDARDADRDMDPMPLEVMGLTDPVWTPYAAERVTPQTWRTLTTPARRQYSEILPQTYVRCTGFANPSFDAALLDFRHAGHRTHVMAGGHVPMLDQIDETVRILLSGQQ